MTPINQMNEIGEDPTIKNEQQQQLPQEEQEASMQNLQYTAKIYTQPQPEVANVYRNNMWVLRDDYACMDKRIKSKVRGPIIIHILLFYI